MLNIELEVRITLLKRGVGNITHRDEIVLTHGPGMFEWVAYYQNVKLVWASLKKTWTHFTASDVCFDLAYMEQEKITLWVDQKQIAKRLNEILRAKFGMGDETSRKPKTKTSISN